MPDVISNTSAERLCQKCGYDLRGLANNRCPECGETFDPKQLAGANVPWLRRSAIGTWSAYWGTVGMVMFHPVTFGKELWNSPRLDPRAARKFRRVLIIQSLLSAMIVAGFLCWSGGVGFITQLRRLACVEVGCLTSVGIFLTIVTDLVQDDSWQRTMNHYTGAPLAMMPLAGAAFLIVLLADGPIAFVGEGAIFVVSCWCWIAHVLVMHVVKNSFITSIATAVLMPAGWMILAAVALLCGVALGSLTNVVLSQWM